MADDPSIIDNAAVSNPIDTNRSVVALRDPLTLDIDDDPEFLGRAKKLVKQSKTFYEKNYHLTDRQKTNEKYLFGRQIEELKLKDYNARFIDNAIYEGEAYLKPIALSSMPDITVKPGSDNDQSKSIAEDVSKIVNSDIQSRERRRLMALAFRQHPVYFFSALKYYWNPEIGADGDYDFVVVHPENLVLDHTSATNNPDDMRFIDESCDYSIKEVLMRFPDKEEGLYEEAARLGVGVVENLKNGKGTDSVITIHEIWFDWPEKSKNNEYEMISGVAWYYGNLLLKKMKNPNWDWTGEKQTFSFQYKDVGDEKETTQEDQGETPAMESVETNTPDQNSPLQGPSPTDMPKDETVFHNHFDNPRKPYIFLGYDQWGKTPVDETSRIEQVIYLQMNLDKRGKQVTEMLDRARGKHVFSIDSGLQKKDIEELDMSNPDVDLLVEGDVNAVHSFIQSEQPSAQMIQDKQTMKEAILDKIGVHQTTRGDANRFTAATNSQLSREGDFTRVNDLVEDTVTYAAEEMANAILQMIKLRYTKDHFIRDLGQDGQTTFMKVNRDMIQDGMEITISASGVDKLKAQQNAFDMAKMKMIDPLTFFKDINVSDPVGRTEKLMIFITNPNMYLQKYIINQDQQNQDVAQMGQQLNGQQPEGAPPAGGAPGQPPAQGETAQNAAQDIMQIMQGQMPPVPQNPGPDYLAAIEAFLSSPQFQTLVAQRPDLKTMIIQWAQSVLQTAQNAAPAQPAPAPAPQAMPGGNPEGTQVGPTTGNPQPGQTGRVAVTPKGVTGG